MKAHLYAIPLALLGCSSPSDPPPECSVFTGESYVYPKGDRTLSTRARKLVDNCSWITDVRPVPDTSDTLIITRRGGEIRALNLGTGQSRVLLSLPESDSPFMELISVAPHPEFSTNGRLFISYTFGPRDDLMGRVSEWTVDPKALLTNPNPTFVANLYQVVEPAVSHNGGALQFGPDGYLYIPWGDGGDTDPNIKFNAANRLDARGSILRVSVDGKKPFAIPPDNPFVGVNTVLPELWMSGLRMPWRMSFTPDGRLIIGDVGRHDREKLIVGQAGGDGGWPTFEATLPVRPVGAPKDDPVSRQALITQDVIPPLHEYAHSPTTGQCILGGYVCTDASMPNLSGKYLFGDFVSGRLWAGALPDDPTAPMPAPESLGAYPMNLLTLGRDRGGAVLLSGGNGLYRLQEY